MQTAVSCMKKICGQISNSAAQHARILMQIIVKYSHIAMQLFGLQTQDCFHKLWNAGLNCGTLPVSQLHFETTKLISVQVLLLLSTHIKTSFLHNDINVHQVENRTRCSGPFMKEGYIDGMRFSGREVNRAGSPCV